ncbi:MAG: TetR/AcrR family transcriptional regulator [Gemmatimonadaceae bacterium]
MSAARAILEEEGFEALTMSRLAAHAGITRRGVYSHFESRAQVIAELFDYVAASEGLGPSVERVWRAASAPLALHEWARHLAHYHPRVIAVDRAVNRVRHVDADAERHWKRVRKAKLANCRRLAEWLSRERQLAASWTVESATDMLYALISSDVIEALIVDRGWSRLELAAGLSTLLRSTLVRSR